MNRSVAQIARILQVDSAQVRSWAATFKEFISAKANPAKGKASVSNDSDFLALAYISTLWEEDPDLDNIQAGLNGGDHHEEKFLEELYLHTPLLQEWPDDLDETWRHGFLLCGAGMQGYLELARNYRHVAESLLEAALKSGEPLNYAYPVLFAYRHTLELYLKIVGEIEERTHSLKKCVELVEKRHNQKIGSPIRGWILELDRIDPGGTAFRYAGGESGPLVYEESWLDLVQFKFAMNKVFQMIDGAILRLGTQGKPARKRK